MVTNHKIYEKCGNPRAFSRGSVNLYQQLENYLENGQWREADEETLKVMVNLSLFRYLQSGILGLIISLSLASKSVNAQATETNHCAANLASLTPLLLNDLPDYANRVIQRTQKLNRGAGVNNYIIAAGQAELEPLNLPRIKYSSQGSPSTEQIFFTIIERQYLNQKVTQIETYHWLFLVPTKTGWRMVMMFSRFGDSMKKKLPTPPQESSDGIIGQGVQLWLRDCRAGQLKLDG